MAEGDKRFWSSLPGILTGVAAIVTALTGLYVAVRGSGDSTAEVASVPPPAPATAPSSRREAIVAAPPKVEPAPAISRDPFTLAAVIDDPDGYTNVRSAGSASAQIIARVNDGERFHTYRQDGNWWQVKTADGKVGYMHISRIRIVSGG